MVEVWLLSEEELLFLQADAVSRHRYSRKSSFGIEWEGICINFLKVLFPHSDVNRTKVRMS